MLREFSMRFDGDLVILIFVLALLILTYKRTSPSAGYNVTVTRKPSKEKTPNYPGVPKKVLAALGKAREIPNSPPVLPTLPAPFSPSDASDIVLHTTTRLNSIARHLEFSKISVDAASLDKDAEGGMYWTVSAILYERVHALAIKVLIYASVSPIDNVVHIKEVALESAPVPTSFGSQSVESSVASSRYASYQLPIPSI